MSKKILVLYAKSGFMGHAVIAQNYANILSKNGYQVELGDVFAIEGNAATKGGLTLYFWGIKTIPDVWRWLYKHWTSLPGASWFKNSAMPQRYPKSQKFILDHKPDFIITTHPSATSIVNYLKEKGRYTGPLFTTFSDWHTQPFHVYKHVNKYLLVIPEQIDDLKKLGTSAEKAVVPGMALDEKYYNLPSKQEARTQLNLPQDKKIILNMGGGRGWEMEETLQALSKIKTDAYTILVAGSDERKTEIEEQAKTYNLQPGTYQVTGFIEPSLYFAAADLLLSKPGGLTSSQAFLSKLPLLVTSALPGQEDENIKYLTAKRAIIYKRPEDKLEDLIDHAFSDPALLEQTAQNAYKIAPVNAPKIILDTINQAMYS